MSYRWTGILAISFLSFGCATNLQFKSSPDNSKVELITNNNQTAISLGETPLQIKSGDITEKQFQGPYVLRFSKDGYMAKDIVINSLNGLNLDVNIELKPSSISKRTNKLIDDLFKAQNLAQKQDYKACLEQLDILQKEFPDVTAIYEMRGSVYMLQGRFDLAKNEINKALRLEPDNKELRTLLESANEKAVK